MYVTAILEFSEDPLTVSNATATWTAVTTSLLEATWRSGIQRDGDYPAPGSATFRLNDPLRNFEPDYAAGTFYPNIIPGRRFRLRITSSAVTYPEGIWYTQQWRPQWVDDSMAQESVVTCGDGFTPLALDDLPGLDPPDAQSYSDVVEFDNPWLHMSFGDPAGSVAVSRTRRVWQGRGKNRRRVKQTRTSWQTAAEASASSGPAGSYQGNPTLGEPSLIAGARDTAVLFTAAQSEYVRAPVERSVFVSPNAFSMECWVNVTTDVTQTLMAGPLRTADAAPIFRMTRTAATDVLSVYVRDLVSASSTSSGVFTGIPAHVVGTFDGSIIRVYIDGELVGEESAGGVDLLQGDVDEFVYVGQNAEGASFANATIDEPAFYEHALSPMRVMAHYTAGAERGFPQQTAADRIQDLVASPLWTAAFGTSGRDVLAQMMFGQPRLEEIAELAHSEGPRTRFFFNGEGNPEYHMHEWEALFAVAPHATFGNGAGEVPYEHIELEYDDEVYTDVVVSHEAGELAQASTGVLPQRVNTEYTDVLLMEHNHVESLAADILAFYETPAFRPASLTLSGVNTDARLQILDRVIGDLVRIKHRPKSGTVIDRVCRIIGFEKTLEPETGHLSCTWFLSRGFNGAGGVWRAGVVGFSEAGSTTIAG